MNDRNTCGYVSPDEVRCDQWAVEESPVNLRVEHLRWAHSFGSLHPEFIYNRPKAEFRCPFCGSKETYQKLFTIGTNQCDACAREWQQETFGKPGPKRGYGVRPTPTANPGDVVYYIKHGNRIKIGTSSNWKLRMQALPHDELLALEPGSRGLEAKRHAQFSGNRIRRSEWFDITDRLTQHIATVREDNPKLSRMIQAHNADRSA